MTCGTPISLFVDMKFGGFCFGPAAGVEEICCANKSRGEHPNLKWGPDLGAPAGVALNTFAKVVKRRRCRHGVLP